MPVFESNIGKFGYVSDSHYVFFFGGGVLKMSVFESNRRKNGYGSDRVISYFRSGWKSLSSEVREGLIGSGND